MAGVIAACQKKASLDWMVQDNKLFPERPIELRFRDFSLQRRAHAGEWIAFVQRGIRQQEGEIAMIVAARTLPGHHFDASPSGPSKLGRVRAFVHINFSDAC